MRIVLGIDSSTQSVKVQAHDLDTGALVGAAKAQHPATTPPRSEQDPNAWWTALQHATTEATAAVDRSAIVAVSVAGQQHGMVVTNAADEPLYPGKLWNDTESASQADHLVSRLGPTGWSEARPQVCSHLGRNRT